MISFFCLLTYTYSCICMLVWLLTHLFTEAVGRSLLMFQRPLAAYELKIKGSDLGHSWVRTAHSCNWLQGMFSCTETQSMCMQPDAFLLLMLLLIHVYAPPYSFVWSSLYTSVTSLSGGSTWIVLGSKLECFPFSILWCPCSVICRLFYTLSQGTIEQKNLSDWAKELKLNCIFQYYVLLSVLLYLIWVVACCPFSFLSSFILLLFFL